MVQLTIAHHSLPPNFRKIYFMISIEVCFIKMWIFPSKTHRFMVSPLMDSPFTSTPPCPAPALTSHIYNLFIYNPSPGTCSIFFQLHTTSLTSQLTTHARYISLPCMIFECRHNIRNQPVSTTKTSPSSFRDITTIRKHWDFGEILKYVFLIFFKIVSHIVNTQLRYS